MAITKHVFKGATTGNFLQPPGRHRDAQLQKGVGLIPLGDRDRVTEYGEGILEERDSIDKYSKYTT